MNRETRQRIEDRRARQRSHPLAYLAKPECSVCSGHGQSANGEICPCVARRICHSLVRTYREIEADPYSRAVRDHGNGTTMPRAEFLADLARTAEKALTPRQLRLFRAWTMGGMAPADRQRVWSDTNAVHAALYRIEVKAGGAFLAAGLFPSDVYLTARRAPAREAHA